MPPLPRLRDTGNHLLDKIPDVEFAFLERWLQRVTMKLKDVVHQFEADVTHVHFPVTAFCRSETASSSDCGGSAFGAS